MLIAAPPACTMPRSAMTCSGALRAMIKPNCPGPKPIARRASVTLGVAGMVWVAAFGALTVGAFALSGAAVAGVAFAAGAAGGAAVVIWCGTRLLYWPPARLALFRDRLLVIQGRHEMRAVWV